MSYRKLDIWCIAREVSVSIHRMTLEKLPKFEMYEEGAQIRRASKAIRSNIVEGYGRRRYKQDFIKFLIHAHSSCGETIDHLETLAETGSLSDQVIFDVIHERLEELSRKLSRFIESVEQQHVSVREEGGTYLTSAEEASP